MALAKLKEGDAFQPIPTVVLRHLAVRQSRLKLIFRHGGFIVQITHGDSRQSFACIGTTLEDVPDSCQTEWPSPSLDNAISTTLFLPQDLTV